MRQLLDHLVGVVDEAARIGRDGAAPGTPAREDVAAAGDRRVAYDVAAAEARIAWADSANLNATVTVPWGAGPVRTGVVVPAWVALRSHAGGESR